MKILTRKVFNFQGFIGVSGRVGAAGEAGGVVSFIKSNVSAPIEKTAHGLVTVNAFKFQIPTVSVISESILEQKTWWNLLENNCTKWE